MCEYGGKKPEILIFETLQITVGNMMQIATNQTLIPTSYCILQEPKYRLRYEHFCASCLTDFWFFSVKAELGQSGPLRLPEAPKRINGACPNAQGIRGWYHVDVEAQ